MPFPSPRDLSNPEIQFASLAPPALAGGFSATAPLGKPLIEEATGAKRELTCPWPWNGVGAGQNYVCDLVPLILLWARLSLSSIFFQATEPFLKPYGFPGGSAGKESACNEETLVRLLGQEDLLEIG